MWIFFTDYNKLLYLRIIMNSRFRWHYIQKLLRFTFLQLANACTNVWSKIQIKWSCFTSLKIFNSLQINLTNMKREVEIWFSDQDHVQFIKYWRDYIKKKYRWKFWKIVDKKLRNKEKMVNISIYVFSEIIRFLPMTTPQLRDGFRILPPWAQYFRPASTQFILYICIPHISILL